MPDERRRTPRFPFIANAEILEKGSAASSQGRVTELSLYGCYVETANTFEKGVPFLLKSPKAQSSMLSPAKAWESAFKT